MSRALFVILSTLLVGGASAFAVTSGPIDEACESHLLGDWQDAQVRLSKLKKSVPLEAHLLSAYDLVDSAMRSFDQRVNLIAVDPSIDNAFSEYFDDAILASNGMHFGLVGRLKGHVYPERGPVTTADELVVSSPDFSLQFLSELLGGEVSPSPIQSLKSVVLSELVRLEKKDFGRRSFIRVQVIIDARTMPVNDVNSFVSKLEWGLGVYAPLLTGLERLREEWLSKDIRVQFVVRGILRAPELPKNVLVFSNGPNIKLLTDTTNVVLVPAISN